MGESQNISRSTFTPQSTPRYFTLQHGKPYTAQQRRFCYPTATYILGGKNVSKRYLRHVCYFYASLFPHVFQWQLYPDCLCQNHSDRECRSHERSLDCICPFWVERRLTFWHVFFYVLTFCQCSQQRRYDVAST